LRLFSFGGCGLALAALALVVFGAIECPPNFREKWEFFALFISQPLRAELARRIDIPEKGLK